jgi:hypothetical protein
MKMIYAMLLAGAFLIARPALAGDDAPKPDKAAKASKKDKKKDTKADDKAGDAPAPEKKADKGW